MVGGPSGVGGPPREGCEQIELFASQTKTSSFADHQPMRGLSAASRCEGLPRIIMEGLATGSSGGWTEVDLDAVLLSLSLLGVCARSLFERL